MATIPVAEARANFSKIVESAATTHERFEVTRNGSRAVVILGADDYDVLLETIDILADSDTLDAIREGLRDLESGDVVDADDVRQAMVEARRLGEERRSGGAPATPAE
ncbi:type II toxin-antitoxin system Phd/YefM family antitoxin [Herbiconiux solani]|uniref:type II toxin-antitoxin system Phd/YefM family antitoxin n=1 Tax=Herbiconiux solani TaxID=661329 RepID=UPI001C3F3346|nr:type II toxin-antitoxin system Phd/YefM family antitoxin [Herbiconiux solani]